MLHQIPRVLARRFDEPGKQKVALLVLDGLALDQWLVLQEVLAQQRPQLKFRSGAVLSANDHLVSRQAVFAGKPPFTFLAVFTRLIRKPSSGDNSLIRALP